MAHGLVTSASGLSPGDVLGKYALERRIGAGGMGEVWAAHDPDLDRRVALKVLRPALAGSDDARARLQREGRAMARLRHPNVITVYEAIFSDGRGVIAMELIDGQSLAGWLATRRTRDEIVAALVAAGRGLAAAHAAGMVHRDFKPHNVLVDRDGRIVVTDFGLARASATASKSIDPLDTAPGDDGAVSVAESAARALGKGRVAADAIADTAAAGGGAGGMFARGSNARPVSGVDATASPTEATISATDATAAATPASVTRGTGPGTGDSGRELTGSDAGALESPLTRTGELLGTPAYMPPEQLAGNEADARSDQFAFCVTVWEALAGRRPFHGKSLAELIENVLTAEPAGGAAIPGRLRSILRRGLARDPNDRWRSMGSMLAAIERAWRRPRRIKAAIAGGAVATGAIAGAIVLATRSSEPASPCVSPDLALREVWSPAIRAGVAARIAGQHRGTAPLEYFDRWRDRWIEIDRATCAKPAAPYFAIRRACLDSLRDETALLMDQRDRIPPDLMVELDYPVIMPEPQICETNPRSVAPIAIGDPARRDEITEVRFAMLNARFDAHRFTLADFDKIIDRARTLGSPPLLAEAMLTRASLAMVIARTEADEIAACPLFDEAIDVAAEAGHERYRVTAMIQRLICANQTDEPIARRVDLARRIDSAADGLADRSVRSQADDVVSKIELATGAWTAAVERRMRARERWEDLGSLRQQLRMMIDEAEARTTRHHGDDHQIAIALLREVASYGGVAARNARAELARLSWMRGDFAGAAPNQIEVVSRGDDDMVAVAIAVIDGDVANAEVVAVVDPNLDPTRISMIEFDGKVAAGRTDAAGKLALEAPRGGVIVARSGSALAAAAVPDRGGEVVLRLRPTVAMSGTVTGFDGVAIDDPAPASRAARREMPAIYATTTIDGRRVTWHAPIAADGRWSLPAVLPGRYVVAADVTSALGDDHSVQAVVTAGASPPPIVLELGTPSVLRVIARPAVGGRVVVIPKGPHPKTWRALDARLPAANELTMADLGPPLRPNERVDGTQTGDAIADVSVLAPMPVVVCVLPGAVSPYRRSLSWIVPGPDKTPPICRDVASTDAPVLIETR